MVKLCLLLTALLGWTGWLCCREGWFAWFGALLPFAGAIVTSQLLVLKLFARRKKELQI